MIKYWLHVAQFFIMCIVFVWMLVLEGRHPRRDAVETQSDKEEAPPRPESIHRIVATVISMMGIAGFLPGSTVLLKDILSALFGRYAQVPTKVEYVFEENNIVEAFMAEDDTIRKNA